MDTKDKEKFSAYLGYEPCFTELNVIGHTSIHVNHPKHVCIRPKDHQGPHWSGCCDVPDKIIDHIEQPSWPSNNPPAHPYWPTVPDPRTGLKKEH